ncbi:penicillin-binding protein [Paraphaeosphaeria sporulosa]
MADIETTLNDKSPRMPSDPRHASFTLSPDSSQPSPTEQDASRNPFANNNGGETFNARVNEALHHWRVPGLALAIVDRHTVTAHGYGISQVGGGASPVTPATIFDIASMSKSFTAAAMALLVQNEEDEALKEVKWDTPVSKLDPELQFATSDGDGRQGISVEDILSHRSGLPGHEESLLGISHADADTPESVVSNIRHLPFAHALRTTYFYNNLMYTCAAHLVSKLSSTPFASFLQQNFWDKLDMQRTWLGPDALPTAEADAGNVAVGSIYATSQGKAVEMPHIPEPEGVGAGSIQSCVGDVARWIHAQIYTLPPLSQDSYKSLRTPRILADDAIPGLTGMSPTFYCLGWEVAYYRGVTIVRHDGSWAGFASSMVYVPEREWGVVILGNSEDAYSAEMEVLFHLVDTLLGVPEGERFGWRDHYDNKAPEWAHVQTLDELFPERAEHADDEPRTDPDLETFVGSYANTGYHRIRLAYDAEKKQIEIDGRDRSYSFVWVVRERAYGHWYMLENVDPASGEKSTMKCKFDAEEVSGKVKRFGVDLYPNTGDLIWFEKEEGE